MRKLTYPVALGAVALTGALLASGCVSYVPVQQPYISRLSSDQLAAIYGNDKLSAEEKKRLTDQNQQIFTEQETLRRQQEAVVVNPYPAYPWYGPYYAPYYPFYPGLSLSLGYVWGRGGWNDGGHHRHHGWRGGHHGRGGGHGGWGGGHRGGHGGGHGRR